MESSKAITNTALNTIRVEAQSVADLSSFINQDFVSVVQTLLKSEGRLVITGIGKSANIANKIVATLNSTGQPALFMHAADAIHGDLGNVQKHDVVLCISKSGNSPEIKVLVPLVKNMGNQLVALTGNLSGYLAQHADLILNTTVSIEACPHNLAPTSSTTAQLAMGDALAMALMEQRGFTARDFAKYHPGGALGKKLYLRMGDLASKNSAPQVAPDTPFQQTVMAISEGRMGAVAVVEADKILGVVTDGDLRRWMQKGEDMSSSTALQLMSSHPKTAASDSLVVDGFAVMEKHNITQILIEDAGRYVGIVHLHDILHEGIF